MKKLFISALSMLAVAMGFTACTSDDDVTSTPDTPKQITVYATTEQPSATRTSLNVAEGNETDRYEVLWSAGDKIKLINEVSSIYAEFTLDNDYAGQSTGEFTGSPLGDDTYTAYYPAGYDGTSWPTAQTYVENNIPDGVPMKAENVEVAAGDVAPISFKNEGGILRLNLKGEAKVTSITISATDLDAITLSCGTAVQLDADMATPFYIAVPGADDPGTAYSGLKIVITDDAGKVCTKTLKSDKTITVQRSMITDINLTASNFAHTYVELAGYKWATENVGAVAGITPKSTTETYGHLYKQADAVNAAASWGSNWALPTKAQWEALKDNCTWSWKDSYSFGGKTMNGYLVTDVNNGNSIFLPAAGANFGSNQLQGERGYYISASQSESGWWGLTFMYYGYNSVSIDQLGSTDGFSVRAVLNE